MSTGGSPYFWMKWVNKCHSLALRSFLQLPSEGCYLCLVPHYQRALIQDLISLGMKLNLQVNFW